LCSLSERVAAKHPGAVRAGRGVDERCTVRA
jgi:hypothetical protein